MRATWLGSKAQSGLWQALCEEGLLESPVLEPMASLMGLAVARSNQAQLLSPCTKLNHSYKSGEKARAEPKTARIRRLLSLASLNSTSFYKDIDQEDTSTPLAC